MALSDQTKLAVSQIRESPNLLDNIAKSIEDTRSAVEKRKKADLEIQQKVAALNNESMRFGLKTTYDPVRNEILQIPIPPPQPTRIRAYPTPGGGMIVEEEVGDAPLPGQQPLKPIIDLQSKAVMDAYAAGLKKRAQVAATPAPAPKPMTEATKQAIGANTQIVQWIRKLKPLIASASPQDLAMAVSPYAVSSMAGPYGEKAQEIKRLYSRIRAKIPFREGGKVLSPTEAQLVFEPLQYGPTIKKETVMANLTDFENESMGLINLANKGKAALDEQGLMKTADEELSQPPQQEDYWTKANQKFKGLKQRKKK